MNKPKLLIVDDETDLLAELKPLLERSGYQVRTAINGEQALQYTRDDPPDLIVLDMLLPRLDGRGVLRQLRQENNWTPVLLLTKVDNAAERVLSLQEGADDYLNKPFDPLELVARVQAILRRVQRGAMPLSNCRQLTTQGLALDRQLRSAARDGKALNLTVRAIGVLEYLMLHAGEVIPRQRLLDEVWGWGEALGTRVVDVRIAEIRRALEDDPEHPVFIETLLGSGYRFLPKVEGVP
jgi:DNA-binding response OmpR family regulator